jgi:hypothetical protein
MQKITVSYTNGFNARHHRSGHLFQGRYKAILVEKDSYLLELSRYIHLNPVRAGIAKEAKDYSWSSYPAYFNAHNAMEWLEVKPVLEQFSKDSTKARKAYKEFVNEGVNQLSPLKKAYLGMFLGSASFIQKMKNKLEGLMSDEEIPVLRRCHDELKLSRIDMMISEYYGVERSLLHVKTGKGNWWQQVAIYFAKRLTHLKNKEIGDYYGGKHYSTVTRVTSRIEIKAEKSREIKRELEAIEEYMLHVKT